MNKKFLYALGIITLLASCSDEPTDINDPDTPSITGSWNLDFTVSYNIDNQGNIINSTQTNYSTEPGNDFGLLWVIDQDSVNQVAYENGASALNQPEDAAYSYSNNELELNFTNYDEIYDVITLSFDSLMIITGDTVKLKKQFFRI